ncbi:MAG TPA: hypothetical protein VG795_03750 [Acidimicrobiia bacterium]|nr:hypothetical protein [Acidimicrobiia bacterium]
MRGRRLVALVSTIVAGWTVPLNSPVWAEAKTICIGRSDAFVLRPGLSMTPTSGAGVTVAVGQVECTGPLDGHEPTGPITSRHVFTYGGTCSEFEAKGWVDYFVPTATGLVILRNNFTGGINLSDPADAMVIHGDHLTGRAFVQSFEGDCVTSPVTRMEVGWVGQWHDKGRTN